MITGKTWKKQESPLVPFPFYKLDSLYRPLKRLTGVMQHIVLQFSHESL